MRLLLKRLFLFARGMLVPLQEPTARKTAEAELRFRNALLLAQQEASPEGILTVDHKGMIISYNWRFVEMWGIPLDVVESRSDDLALASVLGKLSDPQAFLARVRYLYEHPAEKSRDEIHLLDGRTFERFSAPVISQEEAHGHARVWFFDDITERKRAEQAKALYERERAQREFVSTVSHELRTPIMAIQGFAEALREGGLEDAQLRLEFVATIERHAKRLGDLVDDILALSVLESGKRKLERQVLKLSDIIEAAVLVVAPLAEEAGVSIRVEAAPGLRVSADSTQLSLVLLNLLDNAVKYNHPEGWIEIAARAEGREAFVSVSNSGEAVSPKDLPRIFERFYRADARRANNIRGTGLGLSIAREIVELHGGRIWAESPAEGGCTLRFTLALAA